MTNDFAEPCRYPVPDDRIKLDWERIEPVAGRSFAEPTRVTIESHLTWFRDGRNYYDLEIDPNRYANALEALYRVMETPGSRDRWEPIENQLTTVIEFLEVMAEPLGADYWVQTPSLMLHFQLWHAIGSAGVTLSQRKGEEERDLSQAQLVLRQIFKQSGIYVQSDQAFAKQLSRALSVAKRQGTLVTAPMSQ